MPFADLSSSAIVAVRDLDRARAFYRDTLGLRLIQDSDQVAMFSTGATQLGVYVSEGAGTNRANAVAWGAGADFDDVVEELRGKGVTFETYPELGMAIAEGIHQTGDFKAAWFKDPDGNILHINSGR